MPVESVSETALVTGALTVLDTGQKIRTLQFCTQFTSSGFLEWMQLPR